MINGRGRNGRAKSAFAALIGVFAAALFGMLPVLSAHAGDAPNRVGGPCEYAAYPGVAEFLGVAPAPPDEFTATPYQGMKADFRFIPDKPLKNQGLYVEGKAYPFTLINGALPGKAYLEKYAIRPGARVPCRFMVITKGTCTPTLFDFPGIDQADYFEWEK